MVNGDFVLNTFIRPNDVSFQIEIKLHIVPGFFKLHVYS